MKKRQILFEDRIYALIYQMYEFSKKTSKYDDKMFKLLENLVMLRKSFIESENEHLGKFYEIENEFHKVEMEYKFDL